MYKSDREKRASSRIPADFEVRFYCCNMFHSGTVTDLSEIGMFINAKICFPIRSKLELLVPLEEEVLKVPVAITRVVKKENIYVGMGAELLNLPKKYLAFLIKLRLNCQL